MTRIGSISLAMILTGLLLWSCASNIPSERPETPEISENYTASFPTRDVSDLLQDVRKSVIRISSTGIYRTYIIEGRLLTKSDLEGVDIEEIATRSFTSNESTAGTAISVYSDKRNVALLTNAHVINYPDTLISYIDSEGIAPKTYIQSIKIKKNQNNLIYDLPYVGGFEIIDYNQNSDLALLRVNKSEFPDFNAPSLRIPAGNPADLKWGSFVYIIGYPKGYPMVTRGIVSNPGRNEYDDFLTDALFNPGISGGLIMATRNDFRSFEWVGMTNTASADLTKMLVPDPMKSTEYENFDIYRDSVYVETKTSLAYGITQTIPMKRIIEFLESNERELQRMGFQLSSFKLP
ncbi:MAG TPA: serine protease [Halalkalibaculum sp.]|nr:serine protease [Halalkalibaculum sp.]